MQNGTKYLLAIVAMVLVAAALRATQLISLPLVFALFLMTLF